MYRLAVLCYCATWASGRRGRGSRVGSKRAEGETRVQLSSAEKAAVVEVFVRAAAGNRIFTNSLVFVVKDETFNFLL